MVEKEFGHRSARVEWLIVELEFDICEKIKLPTIIEIAYKPSKIYAIGDSSFKEISTLSEFREHAGEFVLEVKASGQVYLCLINLDGETLSQVAWPFYMLGMDEESMFKRLLESANILLPLLNREKGKE
ncbi:MAG TPA: hypothetical protein DCG38_09315 [Eubacteriaceae bacterium]|nr:hypothetical protein [Eubacteriaceae bacterium]